MSNFLGHLDVDKFFSDDYCDNNLFFVYFDLSCNKVLVK